jgi:hypothetical protein
VRVALLVLLVVAGRAFAEPHDAVALLPLDADKRLEIYGQPVASEIARELSAGGIEVVVVGAKMAVPERARLVLDGTITAGKDGAVALAIRIRERTSGTVLDKLDATAPSLTAIDRAAAELSARVLPSVKTHLAALDKPPPSHPVEGHPTVAPPPAPQHVLVGTVGPGKLHDALSAALGEWMPRHGYVAADKEGEATLAMTLGKYEVERGDVPLARAHVRVRIEDRAHKKLFDRVVVTDTVVGDKKMADDQLAARVAREVLHILEPHMRRAVPSWR